MSVASQRVRAAVDDFSYRFYDRPRFEPLKSYDESRDVFVEQLIDVDGVVSVYESGGGPGVPGISDIDMVVVVEDEVEDPERLRAQIEEAKVDEYFFFHGPDVVNRSTFADYYSVLPVPKNLYLHAGEELDYEENYDERNRLAYFVDSFTGTYPGEFLEFLFYPGVALSNRQYDIAVNDFIDLSVPTGIANQLPVHIETRMALHRLNSLRNDMRLFTETAGITSEVLSTFDESITDLRERWFNEPASVQERLLIERLSDSVTACFVFAELLNDYLLSEGIAPSVESVRSDSDVRYLNTYHPTWRADSGEESTLKRVVDRRLRSVSLPASFLVNKFSRDNNSRVPSSYREAINRRDETATSRMAALSTYRFHPLRDAYLAVVPRLHRGKARWTL